MKIGILTAGGDCPGLNAVIRGAVLQGDHVYDDEFVGVFDGFRGLVENDIRPLPRRSIRGLSKQGGTILGTSRVSALDKETDELRPEVLATYEKHELDGIICIGGEGTLRVTRMLHEAGINTFGVPKTIDNDLMATDYTFGFDTAVAIATEAIDRLRTTGDSHHRCMVVEVMGRHAGWIALHAGLAGGAHSVLIPEVPMSLERVAEWCRETSTRGRAPLVVVAEGFTPEGATGETTTGAVDGFGRPLLGGVGIQVAAELERLTGLETRCTTLGHLQRGGVPTAFDRVLATRFGTSAIDAIHRGEWGSMVALRGTDIVTVPLDEATKGLKTVPRERWEQAAVLFG